MPDYLQGKITRVEAEALVKPYEDGKFCVRKHTEDNQHVLCVVYKGKPTHHLMTVTEDGYIAINKKVYTQTDDLERLIKYLGSKRPGWPVALDKPCGGGGGNGSSSPKRLAAKAPEGTPWLHGLITREDSESFLEAGGTLSSGNDGRFLIRTREEEGQYVLALVYKGKATQHLIAPNGSGTLAVNKKSYGNPTAEIGALVNELAGKPQGWPVALKEYIDTNGSVIEWGAAAPKRPPKKKSVKKKGSLKGSMKASKPWLHDKMTNPEANKLFAGSTTDGTFLVRKHATDTYALSVIYKGKPTHHLLKAPKGEVSTVGGKPTGVKGLIKTVDHLREKRAGVWPVPLRDHIASKKALQGSVRAKKAAAAPSEPAPAAAAAAAPAATGDDWLFAATDKDSVEGLIKGNAGGADGSFMVRARGDDYPDHYVLSVMYKGKPTHHLLQKKNGSYIAGKLSFGDKPTVESLIHHLMNKVPKWPVVLDKPVPGGLASRGETAAPTLPPVGATIAEDADEAPATAAVAAAAAPVAAPVAPASGPTVAPPPPPPDLPPWLYGIVTRDASEEIVREHAKENGDFLVRTRSQSEQKYTLVMQYKGRPTHHMIEATEDGKFAVNKKPFDASSLEGLVELLSKKHKSWPAPLLTGIVGPGHIPGADWPILDPSLPPIQLMEEYDADNFRIEEEERLRKLEMDEEYRSTASMPFSQEWLTRSQNSAGLAWQLHAEAAETVQTTTLSLANLTPVETNFDVPSYLWDDCHKKDSIGMLTNTEDGTYLVRRKYETETTCYLDIKYKGEITTHLLEKFTPEEEKHVLEEPEIAQPDESSTDPVVKEGASRLASTHSSGGGDTERKESLSNSLSAMPGMPAALTMYPEAVTELAEIFLAVEHSNNPIKAQKMLGLTTLPDGLMTKHKLQHRVDLKKVAAALAKTELLDKVVTKFVPAEVTAGRRIKGVEGLRSLIMSKCPAGAGMTLVQFLDGWLNGWKESWQLLQVDESAKSIKRSSSTTHFETKINKAKTQHKKERGAGPLDEHATFDQILAAPEALTDALKTTPNYNGNIQDFLKGVDEDQSEVVSTKQILTHISPDTDFENGSLSPKLTMLKTRILEFIHHASQLETVDIDQMIAQRKVSLRNHVDGTVSNMLASGPGLIGITEEDGSTQYVGPGAGGSTHGEGDGADKETNAMAAAAAAAEAAEAAAAAAAAPKYRTIKIKGPAVWLLNGENYGNFRLLDNLIERLKSPLQGWPVQLTRGIANPQRQQRRVKDMVGSGEKDLDAPTYLWPNIGIEDAETKLVGPDGTFLVRKKLYGNTSEFTLAVKFRGEPTHHKLSKDHSGAYLINDQPVGKEKTLDGLVEFLSRPGPWPVVLSNPIRPKGVSAPTPAMPSAAKVKEAALAAKEGRTALARSLAILKAADDRVDAAGTSVQEGDYDHSGYGKELRELDLLYAKSKVDEAAHALKEADVKLGNMKEFLASGGQLPGLCDELTPDAPSYLWDQLTKLETEVKLLGQNEGTFLVRRRKFGTAQQFLLDVVFGGRPTHHSIAANAQGFYIVNNQGSAETLGNSRTLHAVIQRLHQGVRGWPVCLGTPITNPARAASSIPHELSLAEATVTNCTSDLADAQQAYDVLLDPRNALRGPKAKIVTIPSAKSQPAEVVVRAKIQALIQTLGDKVMVDYPQVMGSALPALPADQLATVMLVAATNLANIQPSGRKLVTRKSTGELIPAVAEKASPSKWVDMLNLRFTVGQVRVALDVLEGLNATATASQSAQTLALDAKACAAAMKKLSGAVTKVQEKFQKLKLDATDLQTRLVKARTTPQGEPGAVPPALMNQLLRLESKSRAKLEAVAAEYEQQEAGMAALGVIAGKPHLRQFYLRMVEHLTSVLVQVRSVLTKQKMSARSPGTMDGIDCAFGFVPLPEGGADSGAAQLFVKGILDSDENIIWVAEETGRALAFRFQEQASRLQFSEVGRFARWFSRPVIEMLASFMKNSRIQLMLTKGSAGQSFGMGLVTDLNKSARHIVSQVVAGGLAQHAGVQIGDVILGANEKSIAQLDHAEVMEILAKTQSLKLEIGRGKDWEAPQRLVDVPAFFIRTVDAFKASDKCLDEYDDDLVPTYFNQAMGSDLLGGPLIPSDDGNLVPAADFVAKAGLRADSTEDEFLWFSSDQTDTKMFGYRYQLAKPQNVYDNTQGELKGLGWTNATFFAHAEGDAPGDLSGYNASGGSAMPITKVAADTRTLFRQKSVEAASLNKRVRELESQLEVLRNSTAA